MMETTLLHQDPRMSEISYRAGFTDATRPAVGADRIGTLLHRQEVSLPEGVRASFEVANPFTRVGALVLDLLILAAATIALAVIYGIMITAAIFHSLELVMLIEALFTVLVIGLNIGYFFIFEGFFSGRTPGKAACGMRVINNDGTEIGPREGITRAFLRFAIIGPAPIALAYGMVQPQYLLMIAPLSMLGLMMFVDKKTRGIPDLVAGTLVVQMRVPDKLNLRPRVPPYFMLQKVHFPLSHTELSRLTPEDYAKLEEFGARLSTIRTSARQQAAMAAAAALARRMNYSHPIPPSLAEVFLFEMHAAIKQQLQQLYPDLYA
jgi:uncharacterized RDD family membrane protein YckC